MRRVRAGAAIAVAAGIALLLWLLASCNGSSDESVRTVTVTSTTAAFLPVEPFGPEAVSTDDLKKFSDVLGQPIYWAGEKPGFTYELRRVRNGDIFLRYLPSGTAVGRKGSFLMIATYPLRDAYAAVVRASKHKGSSAVKIRQNGLAVYARRRPGVYYFAYPRTQYQVGVFARTAAQARKLVLRARVVPVR